MHDVQFQAGDWFVFGSETRGLAPELRDRFDLTLECIRRRYVEPSAANPLGERLAYYADFFDLFGVRQPDSTVHVIIDTRDEWSLRVDPRIGGGAGEVRGGAVECPDE